jgi:prolyl oligopeptidase
MRLLRIAFLMISSALLFSACHTASAKSQTPNAQNSASRVIAKDPYIWLEAITSPEVLDWVGKHNQKSTDTLMKDPMYAQLAPEIQKIYTAKDRIPMPILRNGMYHNFWQDHEHVRGIWRRTSASEYAKANPKWETILDIDAVNKAEQKSWVYEGASCLPPKDSLCLVQLSDGGKDEAVVREFDVAKKAFVPNGFQLPEAKSHYSWLDKDHILVGTNFGPGSLTKSGYSRVLKIWQRGTPLADAEMIFEGKKDDVTVSGYRNFRPESKTVFLDRSVSFFEDEISIYLPNGKFQKLPFPSTAKVFDDFKGYILAQLRVDLVTPNHTFPAGSLLSYPISEIGRANWESHLEAIYEPDSRSSLSGLSPTKDFLFLNVLRNVRGQILQVSRQNGQWHLSPVALPNDGTASVVESNNFENSFFVNYSSFTVPTALYIGNAAAHTAPKIIKQTPARFDASDVVSEQFQATSTDGTKVPYFVVHKKGMKLDGHNPTLLYAYGGFEVSYSPTYQAATGKAWIERGGVYALANIRGGGEFGPKWHEAALKEHRQVAYDDFISVSEDLIHRKISSPAHLGIMGGSNGGLLMGVAFTQRPDLYKAVICESALLDMLRYTKLPPGASWIGEYGDPDDPKMAEVIARYSPYQNIRPGVKYPKVFFHISTADDRVQPGHTRKVVARMEEYGGDVLLFENTEGGHGGAADLEQRVKKTALEFTYLFQQLK